MAARENLVTCANDQLMGLGVETAARSVRVRGSLLQRRVCGDHLARDEVVSDAEVLQRALRLGSPEFVGRDVDLAQAVDLLACGGRTAHCGTAMRPIGR
jgi:hypothetical protein